MMHQDRSRLAGSLTPTMPGPDVRRGLRRAGLSGLGIWGVMHLVFFADLPRLSWFPGLIVYLVAFATVGRLMLAHYPHAVFGTCNAVTLLRGTLALTLVTPLLAGSPQGWAVFGIAFIAAALDGLDGRLARRSGLVSGFGARLDMETDSLLALVLAALALIHGLAWPLALVLGASRYLFLLAMPAAPWLRRPLPERFGRKAICAFQLSVLVVRQAPPVSGGTATILAMAAAVAVLASFARDVAWLWRRR